MSVPIRVVLLGSGSSYPSPERYHPSLTVTYEGKTLLFDCGEAAQIRLQEAGISPLKIDSIFITHLHGDHFFGLPGALYSMALQGRKEPLTVYGPEGVDKLKFLANLGYHQLVFPVSFEPVKEGVVRETEDWVIEAVRVEHGVPSLAYLFREKDKKKVMKSRIKGLSAGPWIKKVLKGETVTVDGRKVGPEILEEVKGRRIVYSGDCRPSDSLVGLAEGAELLVHESTYGDEEKELAEERFHSTAREAAEVAKKAGVKRLLLYHYSRRYKGVNDLLSQAREVFPDTRAGKDLMQIEL